MSKATCPPCNHNCDEGRTCPLRSLHRQVMPPEPSSDSDVGYWSMFGIALAAIICAVLAVVHFAKYQYTLF